MTPRDPGSIRLDPIRARICARREADHHAHGSRDEDGGLIAQGGDLAAGSTDEVAARPCPGADVALRGLAALVVAGLVACGPAAAAPAAERVVLGTSALGRPIVARHVASEGPTLLLFGCIHGNECAGNAVLRSVLAAPPPGIDLWVVPQLNPDGASAGTRQNGRGVDLNRNWAVGWNPHGRRWDTYFPGPSPFSEPETRIARDLVVRIRPDATLWYHQHMDLVWAWGRGARAGRVYARAAGMRLLLRRSLPGAASTWQNAMLTGGSSFTVELPAGRLTPRGVAVHARAVRTVAATLRARAARP